MSKGARTSLHADNMRCYGYRCTLSMACRHQWHIVNIMLPIVTVRGLLDD
ncbi:hypothetical protein C1H46_029062 [Malus baccata]|uniref:Uncharacterized protein n=1 Tax=Malus baccata TaxID=106549 RepID=A0A540LFY3_MALBA|nr:hypothetical protein C1H46_029062 [Malus baccata]